MRTRKWGSEYVIDLELYNPAGNEKGNILKKTYKDNSVSFGTTIKCDLSFKCLLDMQMEITIMHLNLSLEFRGKNGAGDKSVELYIQRSSGTE